MTANYLELTELEEDYTGLNRANLVSNELHEFNEPSKRIFSPDLGQFYINKNFQITDANTGRLLLRGIDYSVDYYSKRVFSKSGLDNAYLIHVFNQAVDSVLVTYQGVGGLYTSPAYLIAMMMERYPEGIGPVIYWKNVLFKPDQFIPAGHRHHALEIYALSPMVDSLERIRGGLADKDRIKFSAFYDNTLKRFEDLSAMINNGFNGLLTTFQQTRKTLELQQGDFIYTDSNVDQATLRNYGKWRRHTNTMLTAGGPSNAGTSMSVGEGYKNPIRNTNLYQRIDDPWGQAGDLVEKTLLLQPDKNSFNEGDTVTIEIVGVNIPPLTQVTGRYIGISADNVKDGNIFWQATLDAFGKATIKLETVANGRATGNVNITVIPEQFATAAISLLMLDTSKTPTYDLFFSADAQGLNRITRVNEGAVMYMNLIVNNPIPNENLTLNYSAGTASQLDFITQLPSSVIVPSNGIIRVRLELKNDERAENEEVFVVSLLPFGSIDLGAAKARSEIIINDTSYQAAFNAVFSTDTSGINRITEVNEGRTFYLYANTSLPNGTTVNFEYGGTMQLDDFSERPLEAIVSDGIVVAAITTRNDAKTDGDKILGLIVKRTNGVTLANLSIIVRDTSQSAETNIIFTNIGGGLTPVAEFNEGQTIYIVITTRNVENGTYLDLDYELDGAVGMVEINKDFTAPLPTRVPVTNNKATIAATILVDYKAEQSKNFRCTITSSGANASCIIRDTSVPTAKAKFNSDSTAIGSITEANEGQTVYLIVETNGYAAGTVLNLTYSGAVTDNDFTAPRPTALVVNSTGVVAVAMTIKNDFTSENVELMQVQVKTSGSATIADASLTIRDTSILPTLATWISTTNAGIDSLSSINEGVTAFVIVNSNNLPIGSIVNWSVVNVTTTNNDFDKFTGSVTTTLNTDTKADTITTKLDQLTEGAKTFKITAKITLSDGRVIEANSSVITLNDTSITSSFTVGYCATATDGPYITSVNEGNAFYYIIKGTGIQDGTLFSLTLPTTGVGFVTNGDLSPDIPANSVAMNGNFLAIRIGVAADRITEGDETLIIRATRVDTNIPRDATLIVKDTSTTVSTTAGLYLASGNKPLNNQFKEGEAGYLLLSYTNAAIGDRILPVLVGGASNVTGADFSSSELGTEKSFTATSGTLRWDFTIKANRTTTGDKNFVLNVNNITATTVFPLDGTYKILDTSKTTTYTDGGWYLADNTPVLSIAEGNSLYCQVLPIDGVIGDIYRLNITGGTAILNDDFAIANSANITYSTQGMKINWLIAVKNDRITDGPKTIIASITNVTTNTVCGNWTLNITDSSLTPSAASGYYTAATGGSAITIANEGQTIYYRFIPQNGISGDKWRVSIASNSGASASDINNFTPVIMTDTGQPRTDFYTPIVITAEELTEGNENLILQVDFQAAGTSAWVNKGTSTLTINDTSKTPIFDIYYSSTPSGSDRLTTIGENATVYLIAQTTNVATGTVLQVGFAGSTADSSDFTTAPPYEFPTNNDTLVSMTVQSNGLAYYRFDIKADLSDG